MSLHKEVSFEEEICGHLAAHGWFHAEGDAALYDRPRALFPSDIVSWLEATQRAAWETLAKNHGASTEAILLDRIRKQLDDRGTLDVLRHGVELIGLRQPIALAQFKPALAMNPDILARYADNRLRVVRQVRYSSGNENCIDLVLFLNGLPVATAELKTDFTQSIDDAIDQYRFDRNPRPKGQGAEPLLSFPSGALVHFAVSNSEVQMTTRLAGRSTVFLPLNKGDHGAKGNPPNPAGHRTSYLWKEVWQRDSWLEIIGRYLVTQRDDKKKITSIIFPRYHQLDVTRKLQAKVLEEGAGGKFLIQHSAGSGKTNSIAWSAHFLADLHDTNNAKLFSTVIVISDRNVIDAQLQDALFDFQRTTGVVATIKSEGASKSGQLAEALAAGKKIIVCTIQTFPFALGEVRKLAATEGKQFAVIADEAHSSQTGEAAAKLKEVLSPEELAELGDGGEVSTEDMLVAQMVKRLNMHDQSSAAELFERIRKKAPAYLDLLTSETDEEFELAFVAILERAIHHLEKNKKNFQSLDEEGLSGALAGCLSMPGLIVTQETNSNGHVDLTIEADHSTPIRVKLGEAKIYSSPSYHIKGISQLLSRYTTGRETMGLLINYVRKPDIKAIVTKLKTEMNKKLPSDQTGPCEDHVLKWSLLTKHKHSSGEIVSVGHIGFNLHV